MVPERWLEIYTPDQLATVASWLVFKTLFNFGNSAVGSPVAINWANCPVGWYRFGRLARVYAETGSV